MCPPLYEYRCPQGHAEERLEPHTAPTIHPCLTCGADAERVASSCSFVIPGFKNGQAK